MLGGRDWCADPWPLLRDADVVVTHAGQNAVAEVAAARTPAIVLPQQRPHGEQAATAAALGHAGLAVVRDRWPDPAQWSPLLAEAAAADRDRWRQWCPVDGAEKAAAGIRNVACPPR
ncbi:MAG: glycosyltransferase [Pseudonocardia sp.]